MNNDNEIVIKLLNESRTCNIDKKKVNNGCIYKIFTLLTTCPKGSGNIGDKLITESLKDLIREIYKETNQVYFIEYFRGDLLDNKIDIINKTDGILLPGFPIRNNMYKNIYKLTENLDDIKVNFIPVGSGECTFPGYKDKIINSKYNVEDKNFINYVLKKSKNGIGCRDLLVMKQLLNNGYNNTTLVGDCAWFNINYIGKPFNFNKEINKIVFTEPHSPVYKNQVKNIIITISKLFPKAQKIYSLHSKENYLTIEYEKYAKEYGFIIKKCSHDIKKLDLYNDCDLHIGYRVHGYISFLRLRKPAILFMEDGRGVGQGDILKTGCINAFKDGYENVEADENLDIKLSEMVNHHIDTNFEDYNYSFNIIDETYYNSINFLKNSI